VATVQDLSGVLQEQREQISQARLQTDDLFSIVRPEHLYDRPIPERHRIIFYIGHLEAFDWNLLNHRLLELDAFHPEFDRLFAFGIDPVGGGLPSDQPSDWPSLAQVRDYVSEIRQRLESKLETADVLPNSDAGLLLNVAIEHRLMHAETLAYMLHQLPHSSKLFPGQPQVPASPAVVPEMREIPAGTATLGISRASGSFGWDNEFEGHLMNVPSFAIDKYKVTNREFLEFLNAGGYEIKDLWSDEDWNWRLARNILHPVFWKRDGVNWQFRTMFEEIPLPMEWPVYVSHAEAVAFARWAGKALPSEAQWHRAAYGMSQGSERPYPWGDAAPARSRGNFNFQRWDPIPVNASPAGESAFGVADLLGNGWEWTSTTFGPFPGFERFAFYPGYSADFFDGKHFVMKGGSPRTAANFLRRSFRNWFQPHYQYVYAGFRCVSA